MHALVTITSVLLFCLSALSGHAADWSNIVIGTEGAYPPWNARDKNGKPIGFEIDLARDLCRRMGAKCDFKMQTWNGMIPALTTKRYDAIMAGMQITEERERSIRFTSCYASEPAIFAVRHDHALATTSTSMARVDLSTLEQEERATIHTLRQAFAGAIIGTLIATPHEEFVLQFFNDIADIQHYETLEDLGLDLEAGRIDIALSSRSVWRRMTNPDQNAGFALIGPDLIGGILGRGIGVGLRVEDAELRQMLDDAIAAAIADGSIAKLSNRWFGYDLSC